MVAKTPSNKSLLLNKYKQYRNLIVTLSRLSKKNHYKLFFEQNKTNIKQTCDGIKELVTLNKKRKFTPHKSTLQRNNVIHDSKSISKAFNTYFSSVRRSLDEKYQTNINRIGISYANQYYVVCIYVRQRTPKLVISSKHLSRLGLVDLTVFQQTL